MVFAGGNRWRLLLFVFAYGYGCIESAVHRASSSRTLDFSFLTRVSVEDLVEGLDVELKESTVIDGVLIDVSASLEGKNMTSLLAFLSRCNGRGLTFVARRNQLSPRDAQKILKAIGTSTSPSEGMPTPVVLLDNNTSTENVSISTNVSIDFEMGGSSVSNTTNTSWRELDLSWNSLLPDMPGSKSFLSELKRLIESGPQCPTILKFDVCGLGPTVCRTIGKAIIERFKDGGREAPPLSLSIQRNEEVGDSGLLALAAALRSIASDSGNRTAVFDSLSLSGCHVGDRGVEALSLALERGLCCVRNLDLSNNDISDEGAELLAQALCKSPQGDQIHSLNLGHNRIGNAGARKLAEAFGMAKIQNLFLRSCDIRAEGFAAFSSTIHSLQGSTELGRSFHIDLSGNPLGLLRKVKKSGGKYSASALTSKAAETTVSYFNMLSKSVKKGLQDFAVVPVSAESDDDEEAKMGEEEDDEDDPTVKKCGGLAFAESYFSTKEHSRLERNASDALSLCFGLRRCFFDNRAADALAAVKQDAVESDKTSIIIDSTMNQVLEEDTVEALKSVEVDQTLEEMAERHNEAMAILEEARQRSFEAARVAATRLEEEEELEASWVPPSYLDDQSQDSGWDSDADYEDEGAGDDYF